jgi:hypothetical protein
MTDHLQDGRGADALSRDIERMLAVEPAADFRARVRGRVASETIGVAWRFMPWVWAGGGVLVAASIAMVLMAWGVYEPVAPVVVEATPPGVVPPSAAVAVRPEAEGTRDVGVRAGRRPSDRPHLKVPVVQLSADDQAALHAFLASLTDQPTPLVLAVGQPEDVGDLETVSSAMAPITIAPLVPEEEGEEE